jgi:hypothetical protein
MKRKLVFLLILLGIIGVAVGTVKFIRGRASKQGVLKINSIPSTSIFLDTKHIGSSPFEDKENEGEYTVKLVPDTGSNIASWQGKVKVAANLLTYINADLGDSEFSSSIDVLWLERISSKQSEISVTTNPDGAAIVLDGEQKGMSPISLSDINPGDHTLEISSAGFAPKTVKVKTTSGYRLVASLKLALAPGGSIAPEASPSMTPELTPSESTSGARIKASPTPKITPTPTASTDQNTPDKPYVVIKDTPTGFLRVRFEPSTSASEAAQIKPGEKYSLLDTQNGWYQIKYDGTNTGWISGQYATKVE